MSENSQKVSKKGQLDSINKMLTTVAAVLIIILGLQFIAQDLIAPILIAVFLSILLTPLYRFYRNKGLSSGVSIVLMILTFIVVVGGLVWFVTFSLDIFQNALSEYSIGFKESLSSVTNSIAISENTTSTITSSVSPENILKIISGIANSLGSFAVYIVVVPILAILLLIQADSIPKDVLERLLKDNPRISKFSKFAESVIIYVTGRFKVNLVTGALFAISLFILGVDFPFLWGILTVLLSFIPYVGIVLAAIPPTLLAFAEKGIGSALIVIIAVIFINIFAENVMDPLIQGKGNKISPAVVIVSIIFWGWLLGPVGIILAAPLTVLLKLILSDYRETRWVAKMIEGDYSGITKKKKGSPSRLNKISKYLNSVFSTNKA